jgi:hypothetical protein
MATNLAMVLAHVPIGQYTLQVPLALIVAAAVAVVASSFGLIRIAHPRPVAEQPGRALPRAAGRALTTLLGAGYALVIGVAVLGRQDLLLVNSGAMLFWIFAIPLLPLAHCLVGGMFEAGNPLAAAARLISGGRALPGAEDVLARLGSWPAVALLLALVLAESLTPVVQAPLALGTAGLAYVIFQVAMGVLLGPGWFRGGDLFQATTTLASAVAPLRLRRDPDGTPRLVAGFDPARPLAATRGRQALITLWLAGVLADGIRAVPVWSSTLLPALRGFLGAPGANPAGGLTSADLLATWLEIAACWAALAAFFWLFATLAARLAGRPVAEIARVVSPSLIPIALAYLLAHNLTQLAVLGPLIWTARDAPVAALAGLVAQTRQHVQPGPVFLVQVGAIVAGHVVAIVLAHARLSAALRDARLVLRADLGWLSAMLVYTATSLWILAQPVTRQG